MPNRRLRTILSMQSVLVASLPFLLAVLIAFYWAMPRVLSEVDKRQGQLALAVANETEIFLNAAMIAVRGIALLSSESGLDSHTLQHTLDSALLASPSMRAIYLVDRTGLVRLAGSSTGNQALWKELRETDLSRNLLYMEASKAKTPVWSDTFLSVLGGGLSVGLAMPFNDGVVIGEVELGSLSDFLSTLTIDKDQVILVVDRKGQVIADHKGLITAQQLNLGNIPLMRVVTSPKEVHHDEFDFGGRRMVGALVTVPSQGWRVVVAQPLETAHRAVWQATRIAVAGLIVSALLAFLAAFFLASRLASRFNALEAHARRISDGEDPGPWPVTNVEEFNHLSADLQKMADSISERERKLKSLFNTVGDVIFLISIEGDRFRYDTVNPAFESTTGIPVEAVQGKYVDEVLPPSTYALVKSYYSKAILEGRVLRWEEITAYPKGTLTGLVSVAPLYDSQGHCTHLVGSVRDITERKMYEESLKEAKEYTENLIETASVIIVGLNREGEVTVFNRAAEELTGYSREEMKGRNWFEMLAPMAVYPEVQKEFQRILKGGLADNFENPILTKSGEEKIISWRNNSLTLSGAPAGTISFGIDITEQRRLEEHLSQAQKLEAIGTLAGGIAHDFNNILSAIVGYTELARVKAKDRDQEEDLDAVLKASSRAVELIKQILAFSRTSKDEAKPVQPKAVIKEALKLLRASIPTTVEFLTNLNSSSVVLADPGEIHRIVVNLCTNAALAMQEKGGTLEVSLDDVAIDSVQVAGHPELERGPYIRLTVRDTGCGMEEEVRSRIFEPFYTTRVTSGGTGMGLSVVHGIVMNRGGSISVASTPGIGSTFQVFLPVIRAHAPKVQADQLAALPGDERIMFVDDESMVVTLAQKSLGRLGYRVEGFTDSVKALDRFRSDPNAFDIVISDMTMPNLTGDNLIAQIRAIRPEMPTVICTGYSEKIDAEKAQELGIDEFVLKPVVVSHLTRIIRQLFGDKPKSP